MKRSLFLLFLLSFLWNVKGHAFVRDSTHQAFIHRFNLSLLWFEAGGSIAFKEKQLAALPYGLDKYLYGEKGGFCGGVFGAGLFYREKIGLEVMFFDYFDFSASDGPYRDYLSSTHPGYFLPQYGAQANITALGFVNYRLCYRHPIGKFFIQPRLEMEVNSYDTFEHTIVLKKDGSNDFIEYDLKREGRRKKDIAYLASAELSRRWGMKDSRMNWEPKLKITFGVMPVNSTYNITETPYQQAPVIHSAEVKQFHPFLAIQAGINIFLKKNE